MDTRNKADTSLFVFSSFQLLVIGVVQKHQMPKATS